MSTLPKLTVPMTAARKVLLGRRTAIARLKDHNETDGQALRENEKDWTEQASNEEIADVLLRLSERERREVTELDAALLRIESGTWGKCETCTKPIIAARLKAMPEARRCLTCAS